MTPAIKLLDRQKIKYNLREYNAGDHQDGYGMAAASALGQDPRQVFKTLLAVVDGEERKPVVAIVAVSDQLDLKKLAAASGGRKAVMADAALAERATGYVVGGISPLGQRKRFRTIIDITAINFATIFISGGKRGLEIELSPTDLQKLINADINNIAKN
jgi:Cys-tRNA(Pro)/Cys-tRNA(Cys) deacylase